MKKRKLGKLSINKKSISDLNREIVNGGLFSTGCSDGCTPFQTAFNCTLGNCTGDCGNGSGHSGCPFDDI